MEIDERHRYAITDRPRASRVFGVNNRIKDEEAGERVRFYGIDSRHG